MSEHLCNEMSDHERRELFMRVKERILGTKFNGDVQRVMIGLFYDEVFR